MQLYFIHITISQRQFKSASFKIIRPYHQSIVIGAITQYFLEGHKLY